MKCPIDQSEMEKGILGDQYKNYQLYDSAAWGTGTGFLGGLKNKSKVIAYKCSKCGKIELTTEENK